MFFPFNRISRFVPRPVKRVILNLRPTQEVFREIYLKKKWGATEESVSGPGSSLAWTAPIRAALPEIFKTYQVRTMLDVPCGDFHWMKTVDLSNLHYIGGDIVPELVEQVRAQFQTPGRPDGAGKREFVVMDLLRDNLPKSDLILCRDCLFHLNFNQIGKAIKNFKRTDSKYLLTTTYWQNAPPNHDIGHGSFRFLNLEAAPFNFPKPMMLVDEGDFYLPMRRAVALWKLSDLPG